MTTTVKTKEEIPDFNINPDFADDPKVHEAMMDIDYQEGLASKKTGVELDKDEQEAYVNASAAINILMLRAAFGDDYKKAKAYFKSAEKMTEYVTGKLKERGE